jgi:hypothetical protein
MTLFVRRDSWIETQSQSVPSAANEVLRSKSGDMTMQTIGWHRVDAFGRGGNDTVYLYDTAGGDTFRAFADYSVPVVAAMNRMREYLPAKFALVTKSR